MSIITAHLPSAVVKVKKILDLHAQNGGKIVKRKNVGAVYPALPF
jgi:hypothetical protein